MMFIHDGSLVVLPLILILLVVFPGSSFAEAVIDHSSTVAQQQHKQTQTQQQQQRRRRRQQQQQEQEQEDDQQSQSQQQGENKNNRFRGWTCDALIPNLCELEVETDIITMRGGIPVRYWRYRNKYWKNKQSYNKNNDDNDQPPESQKPPLIVLHGGPSFPHQYLLPLKQIACTGNGRHVIFYDQAGCGASLLPNQNNTTTRTTNNVSTTTIKDTFPWLLDPHYYADELAQLVTSLGIEKYHLLGHSWGSILAQIYALDSIHPARQGLLSMTLSGCISDTQLYIREQWNPTSGTLGQLPPFVQNRIRTLEAAQEYNSPEYEALNNIMTIHFTIRTAPIPDCYLEALSQVNFEIYVGMQGASEFTLSGVLANFNVTGRLSNELSTLPVLLTTGRYDTVRPLVVETMHEQLPLSERILFGRSGHVTAIDEAGLMNAAVADFLARVEAALDRGATFIPQRNNKHNNNNKKNNNCINNNNNNEDDDDDEDGLNHNRNGEHTLTSSSGGGWNMVLILFAGIGIFCFSLAGFAVGICMGRRFGTQQQRQGYETIGFVTTTRTAQQQQQLQG